ncbi:MAG: RNB domain-containing ribonuclease [Bacteroidota bacterium]
MHQNQPPDLQTMAMRAMIHAGFSPDIPAPAREQIADLGDVMAREMADPHMRDLRDLLWSSIDNDDTRDLDQIEFAERLPDGTIRLLVAIADVDACVPKGSPIDLFAARNGTSVYTGVVTFPMLPEELSTGLTSLQADADRLAMVIEMILAGDGAIVRSDVYRAIVRNRVQLAYESLGPWLEGTGPIPETIPAIDGLEEQLRLQEDAAQKLRAVRRRAGALNFETIEARPVSVNGHVTELAVTESNQARDIIESFMVASNSTIASFLDSAGIPSIRRVLEPPYRWDRIAEIAARLGDSLPPQPDAHALAAFLDKRKQIDPIRFPDLSLAVVKLLGAGVYTVEGPDDTTPDHFSLALQDYTHSTAPNRRYIDLVIQRLLKSVTEGRPSPYGIDEMRGIAEHASRRASEARQVERYMRKAVAAMFLSEHIGEHYQAIVTGVSPKGTFARLVAPPAEGRIVSGEEGLDVGDRIGVRLAATDPERGFIDFERLK